MPKYLIAYTSTAATYVEIEAENEAEASDRGWNKIDANLCHQCAAEVDLNGDWDEDSVEKIED